MKQAGILLLFTFSAAAQLPTIAFSGGGGSAPDGTFQGSATFRVPLPWVATTAGAPYSGEQTEQVAQTAADGTTSTTPAGLHQKAWRDAQGRVRIEQPYIAGPNAPKGSPTLVEIVDPVERFAYILDDVARVAHRIQLISGPRASLAYRSVALSPVQFEPSTRNNRNLFYFVARQPPSSSEDLGNQTIDGFALHGTRTTDVIPAGKEGNAEPITITHETWTYPELKLNVLTVVTDPRKGTTTSEIENLKRDDPDPALFRAPGDYKVVEETGTFTIMWGEK